MQRDYPGDVGLTTYRKSHIKLAILTPVKIHKNIFSETLKNYHSKGMEYNVCVFVNKICVFFMSLKDSENNLKIL